MKPPILIILTIFVSLNSVICNTTSTTSAAPPLSSSTLPPILTPNITADTDQVPDSSNNRFKIQGPDFKIFIESFSQCKRNTPEFDQCILDGMNKVRLFIPTGVPELKIPPFDPIHSKEVILRRGGDAVNYKLKLKNVMESGWRYSRVTRFRSNLKQNLVQITQYFPDKHLEGDYEVESFLLQPNSNKGRFRMSLYDLNQTTTFTRPKNSKRIKVKVDVQEIGDMKLHITNLLRGRTILEGVLDRMINSAAWRPGFRVVRPFVNELVSTAFTEIYNDVFNNFDFNRILPPP